MQKTELLVTFFLLQSKENVNRTIRKIAAKTGVSVGSVHSVLSKLTEQGYIVESGDRRLLRKRANLIERWAHGYADGLNRHLGNRHGYCLVNGQKAEYVGNICMDVALIDVTDIPCQEGDKVEIFGDHLPVTVLSNILDTIPYEILTAVSDRVKRIYYQN